MAKDLTGPLKAVEEVELPKVKNRVEFTEAGLVLVPVIKYRVLSPAVTVLLTVPFKVDDAIRVE
jgi:hypothetical protein